jgi:hypothetical protein
LAALLSVSPNGRFRDWLSIVYVCGEHPPFCPKKWTPPHPFVQPNLTFLKALLGSKIGRQKGYSTAAGVTELREQEKKSRKKSLQIERSDDQLNGAKTTTQDNPTPQKNKALLLY